MPLLDHFHDPIARVRGWEPFHNGWATHLAGSLNEILPAGYYAEPTARRGPRIEADVAVDEAFDPAAPLASPPAAPAFAPATPLHSTRTEFLDEFETRVYRGSEHGGRLVAAIELVSPANKDRLAHRQAFVGKCASYLKDGVSLLIVDIVTERRARLHDLLAETLDWPADHRLPHDADLSAVAYRPWNDDEVDRVDIWVRSLTIGEPLPEDLPLWLTRDHAVPVPLDAAYRTTCQGLRIDMPRLSEQYAEYWRTRLASAPA